MRTFGLIGNPLTHSFSAKFFTSKFSQEGIDARYLNFELPDIGDITEMIAEYHDLCGFNVTIPYKEAVIPYLSEISSIAKIIGAVNVVKVIRSNDNDNFQLKGYNTDAPAFSRSIAQMLQSEGAVPLKALVLGSGGASKAVTFSLRMLGITPTIVSRNKHPEGMTYTELTADIIMTHQIIVNTTPLGTFPNIDSCPDIPYNRLTPAHICMDLTYNPEETLFMKQCAAQGAKVKNGAEMLKLQALLSWQIWNT